MLIIVKGFLKAPEATLVAADPSRLSHFWHRLTEGYNTMDLLATFFFAPIIVSSVSAREGDTTLQFQGIATFLGPVLEMCYPALIALTFINLFAPMESVAKESKSA